MKHKVFITGGAGYIGSHTCLLLLEKGYDVTVYDNLSNSSIESLKRVERITGKEITFIQGDMLDQEKLNNVFSENEYDAVIHFAGLKAVGESVEKPLLYYKNNIAGTLNLLEVMQIHGVYNLVFSSSATVYGLAEQLPVTEKAPRSATNPYGQTKLMIEQILEDLCKAEKQWNVISLRYFNPVGAHTSGLIGEDPNGIPNNLLPYISQVAVGRIETLNIFGGDYPTVDGTGVRDYIHVIDLVEGHIAAVDYLHTAEKRGFLGINLGRGVGVSVLEMVNAFEEACGLKIPYRIVQRREGDIAECYADSTLAYNVLGWKAKRCIKEMCEDAWRWQSMNPSGYHRVRDALCRP